MFKKIFVCFIIVVLCILSGCADDNNLNGGFSSAGGNKAVTSTNLKEQLMNRFSFANILSVINGKSGSDKLAFSSMYTAIDKLNNSKPEKTVSYLL